MGRRLRKGEVEGEKGETENAFQAISELQELGFSQEEIVEMARKAKNDSAVTQIEMEKGDLGESEQIVSTGAKQGMRRSWADVVEAEPAREQKSMAAKGTKRWADVAGANRTPQNGIPLRYVEPGEIVKFSQAELSEGAKLWDNSLVGMVIGASPSYIEVAKYVRAEWQGLGLGRVHQLSKGIYLFEFKSKEERDRVLEGFWAIYSRFPLLLKPWRAGVSIKEHFDKIPIWIQLPDLNLDLWAPANLGKVASYVGNPITTDACTAARSRIDYARVMVEVPFHGRLPKEIPIQDEDGPVYYQSVVYEWMPVTCELCGWFGHDSHKCKRKKVEMEKKEEAKTQKKDEGEEGKQTEETENVGNEDPSDGNVEKIAEKGVERPGGMQQREVAASSSGDKSRGVEGDQGFTPVQKKKQIVVSKTPILQNLPAIGKNKKGGVDNAVKNGGKKILTRQNG